MIEYDVFSVHKEFFTSVTRIQFDIYSSKIIYKLHRLIQAWGGDGKLHKGMY